MCAILVDTNSLTRLFQLLVLLPVCIDSWRWARLSARTPRSLVGVLRAAGDNANQSTSYWSTNSVSIRREMSSCRRQHIRQDTYVVEATQVHQQWRHQLPMLECHVLYKAESIAWHEIIDHLHLRMIAIITMYYSHKQWQYNHSYCLTRLSLLRAAINERQVPKI